VFIPSERMRSLFVQWLDRSSVVQTNLAHKDHMQGKVQSQPQTDVLLTLETTGRKLSLAEALRRHEQEQAH
jgi:hypothetical protein